MRQLASLLLFLIWPGLAQAEMFPPPKLNYGRICKPQPVLPPQQGLRDEAFYQREAAKGNPRAYLMLAWEYSEGKTAKEMQQLAQAALLQQLAKGKCNALRGIATLLASRDQAMAKQWLEAAVQAGDASAMMRLAKWEPAQAEALWQKAAARGNPEALAKLIALHERRGGKSDSTPLLKRLVASGQASAKHYYLLAERTKDLNLYRKAAEMGHREALVKLGDSAKYGKKPIESYRYYRLAASQGSRDAMLALAENYRCGIGKAANKTLAERWQRFADHAKEPQEKAKQEKQKLTTLQEEAASGKKSAMLALARRYILSNRKQANYWLEEAKRHHPCTEAERQIVAELSAWLNPKSTQQLHAEAEQGNAAAMWLLARRYLFQGQEKQAQEWYEKAAKAGDERAKAELSNLLFLK